MNYQVLLKDEQENDLTSEKILADIGRFFFHEQPAHSQYIQELTLDEKVENIVKILVGTSRDIRKGPMPDKGVMDSIKTNVRTSITENKPIDVVVAWGCAKPKAMEIKGIDIAELMSLEQLNHIDKRIREFYEHGLVYRIHLYDSWYHHIYGYEDQQSVEKYCSQFQSLVNILDLKNTIVERVSHLTGDRVPQISERLNKNFRLLKAYWEESANQPEEEWQHLPSYDELFNSGWIGTLPKIQRYHYLGKVKRYLPEATESEEMDAVLRFFAYRLMIKQEDLLGRDSFDVDISFLSQPPGAPKTLYGNRLFWRSMPKGTSGKWPAPWTARGFILFQGKDRALRPSVMNLDEYEGAKYELHQKASLRISNGADHVDIAMPVFYRSAAAK
ncbi:hypothetical protein JXA85_04360 [Candidatus Woesearchaeota archaeon]|nr:hypothetical protein [Candidatus Woesearchaeota archaeon]